MARGLADVADDCGGPTAALAQECLAAVLEACRVGRLTRNQHVLLRLGELVAYAECAGALARRAAAAVANVIAGQGRHPLHARGTGRRQSSVCPGGGVEGCRRGLAVGVRRGYRGESRATLPLDRVRSAQSGLLADMNLVADALYGREVRAT